MKAAEKIAVDESVKKSIKAAKETEQHKLIRLHLYNIGCDHFYLNGFGVSALGREESLDCIGVMLQEVTVNRESLGAGVYAEDAAALMFERLKGIKDKDKKIKKIKQNFLANLPLADLNSCDLHHGDGVKERLDKGDTVSFTGGWMDPGVLAGGHYIEVSLKKIGDEYYLMYANRGERNEERFPVSGIYLYRIGNSKALSSNLIEFVFSGGTKNLRGLFEHLRATDNPLSLGGHFQLKCMGFIEKSEQKNMKCALAAMHHQLLMDLVFQCMEEELKPSQSMPSAGVFVKSYEQANKWYKPMIAADRLLSVEALIAIAHEACSTEEMTTILLQVVNYVAHKNEYGERTNAPLMLLKPIEDYVKSADGIKCKDVVLGAIARVYEAYGDVEVSADEKDADDDLGMKAEAQVKGLVTGGGGAGGNAGAGSQSATQVGLFVLASSVKTTKQLSDAFHPVDIAGGCFL